MNNNSNIKKQLRQLTYLPYNKKEKEFVRTPQFCSIKTVDDNNNYYKSEKMPELKNLWGFTEMILN